MKAEANAILATLLSSTTNSKHTRHKTERRQSLCDSHTKQEAEAVRIALVDAGRGWSGVKRECVLLKRKG